ncbi:MAG: hypothetical protein IPI33_11570 [Dehalococcoidia bacterium]|nr:hypothetical protein [Dehalococcoidia bacterium]
MTETRGPVHLIGIGGIHMSAIGQLLRERGVAVSGSDLRPSSRPRSSPRWAQRSSKGTMRRTCRWVRRWLSPPPPPPMTTRNWAKPGGGASPSSCALKWSPG